MSIYLFYSKIDKYVMKIAISGASGFIGTALSKYLKDKGHDIIPLGRDCFHNQDILYNRLASSDVVINLAGASINNRWTAKYKEEILNSRIITTRKIVNVLNQLSKKPSLFISTSAVGIYPKEIPCTEQSHLTSDNFLGTVCHKWEEEAAKCSPDIRHIICRFGVVLSLFGGALPRILIPFSFGMEVYLSSTPNYFPWISIGDLCNAIYFIIENKNINGIVNCVSPSITTYREFADTIGRYKKSYIKIPFPDFIKKIVLGEMGEIMPGGQKVIPQVLIDNGFQFNCNNIDQAISYCFTKEKA